MAIAVCASSSSMMVDAQVPVATTGHSAILVDKTVFIQGGTGADGNPSNAAYALILSSKSTYIGATMLDITKMSGFSSRRFHNSVESVGGMVVNCGGLDAPGTASHKMTCDIFNRIPYNTTKIELTKYDVTSRGGMAVAIGGTTSIAAYFLGGSRSPDTGAAAGFSNEMDVMMLSTGLPWRSVDSIGGIVVLGGQIESGAAVAMNVTSVFSGNTWSTRPIGGDAITPRFGHSAVEDQNGNIYIYGGQTAATAAPLNEVYLLNTTASTWVWKKINTNAEPRAFHASVMLDGTILHTFGQAGPGADSAVNTFSLFNIATGAWTAAAPAPAATVANTSPNKPSDISNNPNDPNFRHPGGEEETKSGKGGVIGGAIGGVAAIIILVGGFIFYRKRQARRHSNTVAAGPYSKHSASASGGLGRSSLHLEEGGDKSKLGRSFTIRQPAPAYIDNGSVQDLNHYNDSKYNDRSAGGYGDEPRVIEYELTDTSGHRYEPGSIAERKRYVEEQQRQLMSGFESVYPDQPLPFSQYNNNNNNSNSPKSNPVGRSSSQTRRNRSQSKSEQGEHQQHGGYTAQSPSIRAQQARQEQYDNYDQYYSKF
ncbi:hypothetical protein FBU30_002819 [Linnemannia zychae]|nr:hypothetical protein FBU30_002819 [Linnemannia zychae]